MKQLALFLIRQYQRGLSAHKGFRCAHGASTGGQSCSAFGYRAIERFGSIKGFLLLRRRLARCSATYDALAHKSLLPRIGRAQAGHCDLPVGDCHATHANSGACSPADLLDCGSCDLKRRWRRAPEDVAVRIESDG